VLIEPGDVFFDAARDERCHAITRGSASRRSTFRRIEPRHCAALACGLRASAYAPA
jgi:hypothetical protein